MHLGVAVAVGHVNVPALGVEGNVGTLVEGLATHEGRRHAGNAKSQQDATVQGAFAHRVVIVVGAIDSVVGTHRDAVCPAEQVLAP